MIPNSVSSPSTSHCQPLTGYVMASSFLAWVMAECQFHMQIC